VRALQEAAILADLAADRGALGRFRNLASRGTRNAIRDVLAARASGKSAELSPSCRRRWMSGPRSGTVLQRRLRARSSARVAARLRSLLVARTSAIAASASALASPRRPGRGTAGVAVALAAGL